MSTRLARSKRQTIRAVDGKGSSTGTGSAHGSGGARVAREVSIDLPMDLIPVVLWNSGQTQGVQFHPWITAGNDCHHPANVLCFKQPERRKPTSGMWKIVAGHQQLDGGGGA